MRIGPSGTFKMNGLAIRLPKLLSKLRKTRSLFEPKKLHELIIQIDKAIH